MSSSQSFLKRSKDIFLFTMQSMREWVDTEAREKIISKKNARKFNFFRSIPFIAMHLACFSVIWVGWSPFAVAFAIALYFVRMFGITGVYHRYFAHKTYRAKRGFQFVLAVIGNLAAQRGPLWWAANHRHHHRFSDTEHDLHSPGREGFWWSHMGWFTCDQSTLTDYNAIKDFSKFPELKFLNRFDTLIPILSGVLIFYFGVFLEAFVPALATNGPQLLVWGMFISITFNLHCTVTINSLMHIWGRKRFNTKDTSKNSFLLAMFTMGEGWHNNHHRYQASAKQGFYWWEIDVTYYILKGLNRLGLIYDLRPVPKAIYKEAKFMKKNPHLFEKDEDILTRKNPLSDLDENSQTKTAHTDNMKNRPDANGKDSVKKKNHKKKELIHS